MNKDLSSVLVISFLLICLVALLSSLTGGDSSSFQFKSELESSDSSSSSSSNLHQMAAHQAIQDARIFRKQSEQAYNKVEADKLKMSKIKTSLARLQRSIKEETLAAQAAENHVGESDDQNDKVTKLEEQVTEIEDQVKEGGVGLKKARLDVQKARKLVESDESQLHALKMQRAAMLSRADKLKKQQAILAEQAKNLQKKSDKEFSKATQPGQVAWNHYADHGAELANEAKNYASKANELADEADDEKINASLLNGVPGYSLTNHAPPLKEDRVKLKWVRQRYGRLLRKHQSLQEKYAQEKTLLSAAKMEAESQQREEVVAQQSMKAMKARESKLRQEERKLKDEADSVEQDEKDNQQLYSTLSRKAHVQESLSQSQFKEMEQP